MSHGHPGATIERLAAEHGLTRDLDIDANDARRQLAEWIPYTLETYPDRDLGAAIAAYAYLEAASEQAAQGAAAELQAAADAGGAVLLELCEQWLASSAR